MREARSLRRSERQWLRERFPPRTLGMDADLADDPGAVADAARDNGIAPDAFAETTGDNGIAPDAFVDVPPAGIEPEDASPQDRGESPIAPDDFSGRPHRSTIGTLLAFWRGRRPHSRRTTQGRSGPGVASTGRFCPVGPEDPGFTRPSPPLAPGDRTVPTILPDLSTTLTAAHVARSRAREEHGDGLGTPFGKTEGTPGPSPCSFHRFENPR